MHVLSSVNHYYGLFLLHIHQEDLAASVGLHAAGEKSEQAVTSSLWQEAVGFMGNVALILRDISIIPHVWDKG